ncbi:MAG TPA: hypothetical protein VIH59_09230, partial [Candidatus Tectomicrobia bacterium]
LHTVIVKLDKAPRNAWGRVEYSDAGNGFALRQGYALVWSGWEPDARVGNHGMRLRIPIATDGDKPIVQTMRDKFVFGTRLPAASLTTPLSYAAATLDQGQARLTVRAKETDARDAEPRPAVCQRLPQAPW